MRPVDPRLVRHDPRLRRHLAALGAIGAALALVVVAQATLLARVITAAFLDRTPVDDLAGELVALGATVAVRAALVGGRELLSRRTATRVVAGLRHDVLDHAVRLGPVGLATESRGELITTSTAGLDALAGYLSGYVPQLVLAVVVPAGILVRLAPVDLTAVAIMAVTVPLIPLFMALVGLATEAATAARWRSLQRLSGHFLDVVEGLPTLRAFGRARHQREVLARVGGEYRITTMETLRWSFLSALALELLATLGVALVAVAVGLRVVHAELGLEPALTVLILAPEVYLPLRQVGARYHQAMDGLKAAQRAFAVLDRPLPAPAPAAPAPAPDLRRATIRLEHVTFTYPGAERPAVDDLTVVLAPRSVAQILGPSGAGKSTVTALMLGFAHPDTGRIVVGGPHGPRHPSGEEQAGVDLRDVDPDAWRAQIAWIPQRPTVITGTVADNVRLARVAATDDEVRAALADAQLLADVESWPKGIDTEIGEAGATLSAGQRRRLALARAWLRRPALVIVDEPTADLDPLTQARVLASLRRLAGDATLVIVSHEPLLAAEVVVRLDGGRPAVTDQPGQVA